MSDTADWPREGLPHTPSVVEWMAFSDWQHNRQRLILREESRRWAVSFLATLALAGTGLFWGLHLPHPVIQLPEQPPAAIALDLAPLPAAAPAPATDSPTAPQQTQAATKPVPTEPPKVTAPPSPAPHPIISVAKREKTRTPRKKPKQPTPQTRTPDSSAPSAVATHAPPPSDTQTTPVAATAAPGGASAQTTHDPQTWQSALLSQLEKFRRYPSEAMNAREEGTPRVTFSMDRQGHVLSVTLAQTSGHAQLDQEALALPTRAQPLPPPPEAIPGNPITLTVPIEFTLSRN